MSESGRIERIKAAEAFAAYRLMFLRLEAWRLKQELAACKHLLKELRAG